MFFPSLFGVLNFLLLFFGCVIGNFRRREVWSFLLLLSPLPPIFSRRYRSVGDTASRKQMHHGAEFLPFVWIAGFYVSFLLYFKGDC